MYIFSAHVHPNLTPTRLTLVVIHRPSRNTQDPEDDEDEGEDDDEQRTPAYLTRNKTNQSAVLTDPSLHPFLVDIKPSASGVGLPEIMYQERQKGTYDILPPLVPVLHYNGLQWYSRL